MRLRYLLPLGGLACYSGYRLGRFLRELSDYEFAYYQYDYIRLIGTPERLEDAFCGRCGEESIVSQPCQFLSFYGLTEYASKVGCPDCDIWEEQYEGEEMSENDCVIRLETARVNGVSLGFKVVCDCGYETKPHRKTLGLATLAIKHSQETGHILREHKGEF